MKLVVSSKHKTEFDFNDPYALYCLGAADTEKRLNSLLRDAKRWFNTKEVWFYGVLEVVLTPEGFIIQTISLEKGQPFELIEVNVAAKKGAAVGHAQDTPVTTQWIEASPTLSAGIFAGSWPAVNPAPGEEVQF